MQLLEFGSEKIDYAVVFTTEEFVELSKAYSNLIESYEQSMYRISLAVRSKDLNKIAIECRVGEGLIKKFSEDIAKLYRFETPEQRAERQKLEDYCLNDIMSLKQMFEGKES